MTRPDRCAAFAPGSIGNLACGFDVLGLALEGPGDTVVARLSSDPGVRILSIQGDEGRLSWDPEGNTAGAAARAVLERVELPSGRGVGLDLRKGLPLAAGMGGSAASAVAAAVAVNELLNGGLSPDEVLRCALAGEAVASGASHPDNAAPALLGGMVLVPAWNPLRAISLQVPRELYAVHVHPHLEVETRKAREILGDQVPLKAAVAQWGNTAALVAGLFREDWDLISRAVEDRIAEPARADFVPGFHEVKRAALDAGALGASLSGSGPSLFALCRGRPRAEEVGNRMVAVFQSAAQLRADLRISRARAPGARVLPP